MPTLRYGSNAIRLPDWAEERVKGYLDEAGLPLAVITSTLRTPAEQARIMVENYSSAPGWAPNDNARKLYSGATGRQVIAGWQAAVDGVDPSASSATRKAIAIQGTLDAIKESGYQSDHMKTSVATVDIGPGSSGYSADQVQALVDVLKSHPGEVKVQEVFAPGSHDAAIHFPLIPPSGQAAWPGYDGSGSDESEDGGDEDDDSGGAGGALLGLALLFGAGWAYKRGRRKR